MNYLLPLRQAFDLRYRYLDWDLALEVFLRIDLSFTRGALHLTAK
jgi:hypothetical protein